MMNSSPTPEAGSVHIAPYYKMNHAERGIALIFNHEFYGRVYAPTRSGTGIDCKKLGNCLTNLGFQVTEYPNLKSEDIQKKLKDVSEIDHTDHDCLVVAIMTHGNEDTLSAYDKDYNIDTIWPHFTDNRCPSLAGKPKIFFIQACRGSELDNGISLRERTETDSVKPLSTSFLLDFLIVYATAPGHRAWRNEVNGSWFIQALCVELDKNGKELDLLTLLTLVNKRVAIKYESYTPGDSTMNEKKQMPCITSMLRRLVWFNSDA